MNDNKVKWMINDIKLSLFDVNVGFLEHQKIGNIVSYLDKLNDEIFKERENYQNRN